MIAMLVAAIAVPSAFGANAILFGTAFLLVRLLNLGLDAVAGRHDPGLRRALVRFAPPAALAPVLILLAGFFDGPAQVALWIIALVILYAGALIGRGAGWRGEPAHFAERHGLIVIIALGESIVSIGVGSRAESLTPGVVAAAVLGMVVLSVRSGGRTSTSLPSYPNNSCRRRPARLAPGSRATTTPFSTSR